MSLSLFRRYPVLGEELPYVSLGDFPTPVERLERLGKAIGVGNLYVKRDDVSGVLYGGNKVRKLEFLLGRALGEGRREVLTFGAAGSNHALATAVYAKRVGLGCISMLLPQPNAHYVRKNLLMAHRSGAELHHYSDRRSLAAGTAYHIGKRRKREGNVPAVIPFGGTSPLGTVGFVNAAFELEEQVADGRLPEPDYIYVTLGSMGTAVGLALGLRAAGLRSEIVAVRVVDVKVADESKCSDLFLETGTLLRSKEPSFPVCDIAGCLRIRHEFFGGRYALYTREGMDAVRLMMRTEGIELDGTYTGKTLAALLHDAERGVLRGKTVLFWNTLNSRDFSDSIRGMDYRALPRPFHRYFEEEVQPLERDPGCGA